MKNQFLAFNYFSLSHAATFNNYFELSKCVDYYNSFGDYKNKLKDCFAEQGLKIDDKTLGVIKNKSRDFDYGAIDKVFNLGLWNWKFPKYIGLGFEP